MKGTWKILVLKPKLTYWSALYRFYTRVKSSVAYEPEPALQYSLNESLCRASSYESPAFYPRLPAGHAAYTWTDQYSSIAAEGGE